MDDKLIGYIIIGIILGGVFLFNLALFLRIKKGDSLYNTEKFETYTKFFTNMKNPYANEEKDVEKLSEVVRALDKKDKRESHPD